jgi:predicted metal-dependent phosphoesterase TrpH
VLQFKNIWGVNTHHMDTQFFADLHNHTTASDGDFAPAELVKRAKALNLKALAITDHDTINGVKSAVEAGRTENIEVIPGVEVSVRFKQSDFVGTLHLLCYFKPERLEDEQFAGQMHDVLSKGRGEGLVRARVNEINLFFGPQGKKPTLKRDMTFEDISELSPNASRRHFALALNQTFKITDPEAVTAIIGNDSPAYLPSGIDFDTAVRLIRDLNLLAVLAHPAAGSFPGKGHYKEVLPKVVVVERLLPKFIKGGIKGIEVYYPGHTREHQLMVAAWALEHGLLITGGSDCHDAVDRPIGVAGVDEKLYQLFKEQLQ